MKKVKLEITNKCEETDFNINSYILIMVLFYNRTYLLNFTTFEIFPLNKM